MKKVDDNTLKLIIATLPETTPYRNLAIDLLETRENLVCANKRIAELEAENSKLKRDRILMMGWG